MTSLNLQDILDMFQNGERRYAEDPAFRAVIESLKGGLGVYAVLDHVLRDLSSLRHILKEANVLRDLSSLRHILKEANGHMDLAIKELEVLQKQNQKLNDEVASWKDANDGLRKSIDSLLETINHLEMGENL